MSKKRYTSDGESSGDETTKSQSMVVASSGAGTKDSKSEKHKYNAFHRNPLYCGAETSCSWEIRQVSFLALHAQMISS